MFDTTPNLGRALKLATAPILLATLGACAATGFNADVSRFQSQLPAPQGQSFAVVADDPGLAGGLEFALYADYVETQMAQLGYTQGDPQSADLLVRFDYGVDKGRERVRRTGFVDPFYSPWVGYRGFYRSRFGYGSRFGHRGFRPIGAWGYGFYDPWFGGGGVRSYTVFTSDIEMKIDRKADGQRLFEGRAEAISTSNRLQYLVPNLVEAMFTDFPGNSGETLRISIRPEDTKVRRIN
ncbi:DUF4136 domain-containing protein [Pontixanthobacter sp.]|uniref:DUF4136 domain-containing protein n=1 Tax=Pontixanthobacter sp. TaxID=2792078 RepID=UPI003C7B8E44